MSDLEREIQSSRAALDCWLHEVYGESYGNFYGELDISYEHWGAIEAVLKSVFETSDLAEMSDSSLDDILFFISRSDEGGRIIAWLRQNDPSLSNIANLGIDNFLVLCRHALKSEEDCCDYQLANCFKKFESLSKELKEVLILFFKRNAIYTKRISLDAMAKHRLPNLEVYIAQLWEVEDEWAKLSCLEALRESGCNDALHKRYKKILVNSKDKYVRENAKAT